MCDSLFMGVCSIVTPSVGWDDSLQICTFVWLFITTSQTLPEPMQVFSKDNCSAIVKSSKISVAIIHKDRNKRRKKGVA